MQSLLKKRTPPEKLNGRSVGTWLDKSLIPLLDAEAGRRGVTRSKAAKQIIIEYLSNINDETPAA